MSLTLLLACEEHATGAVTLDVKAAPSVSRSVVQGALDEIAAIWHPAGIAFQFAVTGAVTGARDSLSVQVVVDDEQGRRVDNDVALGWVTFDPSGVPEPIVHVSRRSVVALLEASARYRERSTIEQEMLMGRALGRALAHELGHYVLASKTHTAFGLMRGSHSTDEFFSPARTGFQIDPHTRERLVAHSRVEAVTAGSESCLDSDGSRLSAS